MGDMVKDSGGVVVVSGGVVVGQWRYGSGNSGGVVVGRYMVVDQHV